MPISFENAHEIAVTRLRLDEAEWGISLAMVDECAVKDERGWIFYWNTESFVKNGTDTDPIAGNAPIVVLRDGAVRHAPTACGDAESIFRWLSENPDRN